MQEDKAALQDWMGKEHQALQKEGSYHWCSQKDQAVVDTLAQWKEETKGRQAVHSVEKQAVVLALEDSSSE